MPKPFAALPMYDWPEVQGAWDAMWAIVRDQLAPRGIEVAEALVRDGDHEAQWIDSGLLIGQTCGWPFVSALKDKVSPFARFNFGLGGSPGDYHSIFITRGDADPRGVIADANAPIAINSFNSQSGFRALSELADGRTALPASRFVVTGGHRNSIRAVAEGRAQLAAIDAQSWWLATKHEPAARNMHAAGRSSNVPGLPLITAPAFASLTPELFAAMKVAADSLPPSIREALGIAGVVEAVAADYDVLNKPPFGAVSIFP